MFSFVGAQTGTLFYIIMGKYTHLNAVKRGQIEALKADGKSAQFIAKYIHVNSSTIYRELKRNGSKRNYNAKKAEQAARNRKQHLHKRRKYKGQIRRFVLAYLAEDWSPKQISGYLKNYKHLFISHETIYQVIREDKQAGGKLYLHLRHKLKHRSRALINNYTIPGRLDISERPPEADGTRFGDWEGDLILGPENKGAILTLTERLSNYSLAVKLDEGKRAEPVAKHIIAALLPFKKTLKTLTLDNGIEFSRHDLITKKLGIKCYFARPYHSWEKGAIENYNGLLRQYIPKKRDLTTVTKEELRSYQFKINGRPRAKLNFNTPKFVFYKELSKFALVT